MVCSYSSKAVSCRLDVIHAGGGPFDPCDKLIYPSTCVDFHLMVGIDPLCVSLHVRAGLPWMIHPTLSGHFGSPLEGRMRPFDLSFALGMYPSVWGSIGESLRQ